jgi:hypothetical protein
VIEHSVGHDRQDKRAARSLSTAAH